MPQNQGDKRSLQTTPTEWAFSAFFNREYSENIQNELFLRNGFLDLLFVKKTPLPIFTDVPSPYSKILFSYGPTSGENWSKWEIPNSVYINTKKSPREKPIKPSYRHI